MNIAESARSSIKNVFANKMRAFLTMLGIIIGIGSVIMIMAIGSGSQAEMNSQFEEMGLGRITVMLASYDQSITEQDLLTIKDYTVLEENEDIKYLSASLTYSAEVKLLDPQETNRAVLTGIYGDYEDVVSPTVLFGRYIIDNDIALKSNVCVINNSTAVNVFGTADDSVIGKQIHVPTYRGTQKFTVVGVLDNPNAEMEAYFSNEVQENIFLPITTLQNLLGTKRFDTIQAVVVDPNKSTQVATALTKRLDILHGTEEKYYAQNTMSIMDEINTVMGTITGFISAVAGISLVVGGIGVMNIMLVTVTERTREIGVRKSIGAKRRDIRTQFLLEAIILTGIGGVLGLILGYTGGIGIGGLIGVTPVITIQSILLAVGISCGIGILFGVYPANKAAKLDPIEALRYE
jgi:putative ABC transport system permease protein